MDELVRQYLVSKGYQGAATKLQQEVRGVQLRAGNLGTEGPPSYLEGTSAGDQKIIAAIMSENQLTSEELTIKRYMIEDETTWTRMYSEGYNKYYSWAVNTLDVVKPQLMALCFPLFVQCYIALIRKDATDEARAFWDLWHKGHIDAYGPELRALSMLTSRDQLTDGSNFLASNPFILQSQRNKFKVTVSNFSFGILTTFLAQNELLLIAAIVNDRIEFHRVEEVQDNGSTEPELLGYLSHKAGLSANYPGQRAYGLTQLMLGVPGKGKPRGSGKSGGGMPDYRNNETYRSWLEYIVLRDAFINANEGTAQSDGNFFSTRAHHSQRERADQAWSCSTFSTRLENRGEPSSPSVLFTTLTNATESLICMDINRSVDQAVGGCRDGCVRVWDLRESGAGRDYSHAPQQNVWEYGAVKPGLEGATYKAKPLFPAAVTSTSTSTSTSGGDEASEGIKMLEFRGHSAPIYGVSQDKSGKLIVSGSSDESIRLWERPLGQCVGIYTALSPVWDVSFGPIGYYFASANMDRTVSLYATDRVAQVRLMTGHTSDATCVTWHDNGTLLASGSDDKTVRLWDIREGNSVRLLQGSNSSISSITISPIGDRLAAGTDTGVIHVWDLATARHMARLQGHKGPVHSLSFSQNGAFLTSGGQDCSVRVWDVELEVAANDVSIVHPLHSYFTKFTPVYHVNYSPTDLITAGGPYSTATMSGGSAISNKKTEEEVISALGLSTASAIGR